MTDFFTRSQGLVQVLLCDCQELSTCGKGSHSARGSQSEHEAWAVGCACLPSEQLMLGAGFLTPSLRTAGPREGRLTPANSPVHLQGDLTEAGQGAGSYGVVLAGVPSQLQELLGETGGYITGAGVRLGTQGMSRKLDPSCKAIMHVCGSHCSHAQGCAGRRFNKTELDTVWKSSKMQTQKAGH